MPAGRAERVKESPAACPQYDGPSSSQSKSCLEESEGDSKQLIKHWVNGAEKRPLMLQSSRVQGQGKYLLPVRLLCADIP